jgi:hypothetical protein
MANFWGIPPFSQAFSICLWITLTNCYVVSDYDNVIKQTTEDSTTCISFLALGTVYLHVWHSKNQSQQKLHCKIWGSQNSVSGDTHLLGCGLVSLGDILLGLLNMKMKGWQQHHILEELNLHKLYCHIPLFKSHSLTWTQLIRRAESFQQNSITNQMSSQLLVTTKVSSYLFWHLWFPVSRT